MRPFPGTGAYNKICKPYQGKAHSLKKLLIEIFNESVLLMTPHRLATLVLFFYTFSDGQQNFLKQKNSANHHVLPFGEKAIFPSAQSHLHQLDSENNSIGHTARQGCAIDNQIFMEHQEKYQKSKQAICYLVSRFNRSTFSSL